MSVNNLPPVFHGVDQIARMARIAGADISGQFPQDTTTIVRSVNLRVPGPLPKGVPRLTNLLVAQQLELQHAAELCGATALKPIWGLVDMHELKRNGALPQHMQLGVQDQHKEYARFGITAHHALVAKMALLSEVEPVKNGSATYRKIEDGMHEYYATGTQAASNVVLNDMGVQQFVTGVHPDDQTQTRKAFLVDPDVYATVRDASRGSFTATE